MLDDPKRYRRDPHDDLHVVKTLHKVLSEADVIVGHNSDSFDKRWIDTRILFHGLDPLPPIISIDTKKVAKGKFYFNSNSLDYLGQFLKVGRKTHTSPGLWMRVLNGDAAAIREMVRYNIGDIVLLDKVYQKLKPYTQVVNLELFGKREGCPRCGSKRVQSRGVHRAISRVYRRFVCTSCGGWYREALNDKSVKTKKRVL